MNRRERHVGPVGQKCHDHPDAGLNLRRERTPGAPPDENEGRTTRPARPRDCPGTRVAERRAKRTRRCMTHPGGEIKAALREGSIGGSAASVRDQMRRVGFTDHTRATDRRRRSSSRHDPVRSASVECLETWLNRGIAGLGRSASAGSSDAAMIWPMKAENRRGEPFAIAGPWH